MYFSLYGETWKTGPTLAELEQLAKTEGVFARAEESGSEGCYVEVCRWQPGKTPEHKGHFARYAFEKCFGGECGTEGATAAQSAQTIAGRLNALTDHKEFWPIIHRMPDYKE